MKELLNNVYEDFCEVVRDFIEFFSLLGELVLTVLIYLTIPLWVGFYAIYKKVKGPRNNESNSFNE